MQIVADGPETETQILKGGFVKMILAAEKSIWIQTPYLIPDDSMMNALEIAIHSGVDVRIMIPCMPDHPFYLSSDPTLCQLFTSPGSENLYL